MSLEHLLLSRYPSQRGPVEPTNPESIIEVHVLRKAWSFYSPTFNFAPENVSSRLVCLLFFKEAAEKPWFSLHSPGVGALIMALKMMAREKRHQKS